MTVRPPRFSLRVMRRPFHREMGLSLLGAALRCVRWPPCFSLRVMRCPPGGLSLLGAALRCARWPPSLRLRFCNCPRPGRQSGAALLSAMLTVTLVATFAAAALWQQWRSIEVETAERARVQSAWILTGALDWSRLILREDSRSGGADHLAEPWAVPLNEARLASFLAVDKNASETEREAFLSGQMSDLQARLNVINLIEGGAVSPAALAGFTRLFELLGLPKEQLSLLAGNLLEASKGLTVTPEVNPNPNPNPKPTPSPTPSSTPTPTPTPNAGQNAAQAPTALSPLMPQRVDQLVWLGLPRETLAVLERHITLLPERTAVNLNTASAEVIYAATPGLDLSEAQRLVSARQLKHFRTLAEANQQFGGPDAKFKDGQHAVTSRFFEVRGRLRVDQIIVQERSVLRRDGLIIRTLWRDRGVVTDLPSAAVARP